MLRIDENSTVSGLAKEWGHKQVWRSIELWNINVYER